MKYLEIAGFIAGIAATIMSAMAGQYGFSSVFALMTVFDGITLYTKGKY